VIDGSADPTWSGAAAPANDLLERVEIDGLDHSLQVEGDPLASLDVLRTVIERIAAFLDRG
jgi:hypothetical protein